MSGRIEAADAARIAAGLLLHRPGQVEAALNHLLRAAQILMESAGIDPDEEERAELHRSITAYIQPPRRLGGASISEAST